MKRGTRAGSEQFSTRAATRSQEGASHSTIPEAGYHPPSSLSPRRQCSVVIPTAPDTRRNSGGARRATVLIS